jgi:hypothetical protein
MARQTNPAQGIPFIRFLHIVYGHFVGIPGRGIGLLQVLCLHRMKQAQSRQCQRLRALSSEPKTHCLINITRDIILFL